MPQNRSLLSITACILFLAPCASAQLEIRTADGTASIKFGALVQVWGDWSQIAATSGYAQNLYLHRIRLITGGQIMPGLTFFAETDDPNLGKSTGGAKTISSGFILQDAYLEYRKTDAIFVDAGLILVPFCRNCLNGAPTQMTLDVGSYSFTQSVATQSVNGRDTGLQLRGYLAADRLEYRAAVLQGARNALSNNSLRFTGRLQYNLLDPEKVAFFYPGTSLGTKKTLAVGAAYDAQGDYKAWAGDAYFDFPLGRNAITAEGDFTHWDGGATLTTIPEQNDLMAQAGFYFKAVKLLPYVRYESKSYSATAKQPSNERRYQVGVGYYLKGYNANIKAAIGRVDPKTGPQTNEFTVQLQGFYF